MLAEAFTRKGIGVAERWEHVIALLRPGGPGGRTASGGSPLWHTTLPGGRPPLVENAGRRAGRSGDFPREPEEAVR
ncbi:hypothetical protein ACFS5L_34330 [Streptomyces phyllanthi]|uniref:Uncharacterized protein n=1 Tax=Streptomyces phyllanthi TaxID=1803180 RepID=A0A5N8W0B4_9ACTN|nr:hypothetical protein [Streptomyces phyllanthi]MPY40951.1 hypothetical protein [Streptomyces phyllanthi]